MGLVCLSIHCKLTKSQCQTVGTRDASRTRLFECEGGGGKSRISLLLVLLMCSCGPTKTKRLTMTWKAAMAIVRSFPQAPTCCESMFLTSRPFRSPKGGMSFIMNHQMALNPDVDPSTAQIFVP
jgi:hypothetical protein